MCAALPNRHDPTDELALAVRLMNETMAGITGIMTGAHVCPRQLEPGGRRAAQLFQFRHSQGGLASPWRPRVPLRSLERPVQALVPRTEPSRKTSIAGPRVSVAVREPELGYSPRTSLPSFASLAPPGLVVLGGCADPGAGGGNPYPSDRSVQVRCG